MIEPGTKVELVSNNHRYHGGPATVLYVDYQRKYKKYRVRRDLPVGQGQMEFWCAPGEFSVMKERASMDITERCRIHAAKMDEDGLYVTGNVLTLAAETIEALRLHRDDCLKCKADEQCPRSGYCPFR